MVPKISSSGNWWTPGVNKLVFEKHNLDKFTLPWIDFGAELQERMQVATKMAARFSDKFRAMISDVINLVL